MTTSWVYCLLVVVPVWMVVGNCLVMLAVIRYRNLQNLLNTVIASLALTDFLLAVFVVPCSILQLICGRWVLGFYACLAWTGSDVILSTSSIMHLCAIAIHRYRGIAYPLHTRSASNRHVAALVVPAWFISIALSIPFIVQATIHQSYVLQSVSAKAIPFEDTFVTTQKIINEKDSFRIFLQPSHKFGEISLFKNSFKSDDNEHFLLESIDKRNSHETLQVRTSPREDETMLCGIFNHVFAVYSSLVSFFIPLAVMVFADIGSIRTLRKNVSIKLKTPSKCSVNQTSTKPAVNKLLLEPYPSSTERISNENLSVSTLTSPLTPTFRNQIPSQTSSKHTLFFTETSSAAINLDNLKDVEHSSHTSRTGYGGRVLSRKKRLQLKKKNVIPSGHNSLKFTRKCFWGNTKKNDRNFDFKAPENVGLRFNEDDRRRRSSLQPCESVQISSGYFPCSRRLKIFKSVSHSKKRTNKTAADDKRCSGNYSTRKEIYFTDHKKDPEKSVAINNKNIDNNKSSSKTFRPRTRSLVKMEMFSRSTRVNGRERRAEKTLIWVFLLFVGLWLPFFCINLAYGICGHFLSGYDSSLQSVNISIFSSITKSSSTTSTPSTTEYVDKEATLESKSICNIPSELFTAFTWLGYLSSGVNPCIYTLLNKDFRRAFKNTLMCKKNQTKISRLRPLIQYRLNQETDVID